MNNSAYIFGSAVLLVIIGFVSGVYITQLRARPAAQAEYIVAPKQPEESAATQVQKTGDIESKAATNVTTQPKEIESKPAAVPPKKGVPEAETPRAVSAVVSQDKTKVTVAMSTGLIATIKKEDLRDYDMHFASTENGVTTKWMCPVAYILNAQMLHSLPGKVLLNVGSGSCPADSDFSQVVVIDPLTKAQYAMSGSALAFSFDESCALTVQNDGGRGGSPTYVVANPHSGALVGQFETFTENSPVKTSFAALTASVQRPQTIDPSDYFPFKIDSFEGDSCRVVVTTQDVKRYGGIWKFSVNVWGKNPKLIAEPLNE
jgi:hypothetical protein